VPANARALTAMLAAEAHLVDVLPAAEALGLGPGEFLHAGPPVEWERASGPMRGALVGAMLFEGLAATPEDAERRLAAGDGVGWAPCHSRGAVGPMAGVVSPSMWVFCLRDEAHHATSWCSLNEGLGKVLRYGAYGVEVIERLHWMSEVLGPLLQRAVRAAEPVDVRAIISQMVQMGDEGHNRNRAGTLMFLREVLPAMIDSGFPTADVAQAVRFVSGNDHFFLNLVMPAWSRPRWTASPRPWTPSPLPLLPFVYPGHSPVEPGPSAAQVELRRFSRARALVGHRNQGRGPAQPEGRHVPVDRFVLAGAHQVGLVPDAGPGVLPTRFQ
jgi:hypothetical protein